jgi:hypothetical protein
MKPLQSPSWPRFFLLSLIFFAAFCIAGLIPTPGAWSDVRSQWLTPLLTALLCVAFLIVTAWSYWKTKSLSGLQAILMALLLGTLLLFVVHDLSTCIQFLKWPSRDAFIFNKIEYSPSFSELKRRSKHATFVVDDDKPDFIIVAIGEDMGTHFTRFKTLKIDKATGVISKLETDQSLEDKWQVEFEPK